MAKELNATDIRGGKKHLIESFIIYLPRTQPSYIPGPIFDILTFQSVILPTTLCSAFKNQSANGRIVQTVDP